ncbi:hypothetical protein JOF48_000501 [Arthrobacter stackebrandtii]|uniref:Uncharacterized protein n=1 Tax=Arthrobacter stackebrandtii TaxID=272161 RepID=A0ABS4YTI2_9MICC|nr:hypothetical protein [Arthrobacter stackebrandtii]MBP2411702.1 hypothetical protein [Arthrobacter stackebrandtii]PYG99657.1 hypothetical protein CVV67_13985 [Arthrobacter stackebrandtii]
MRTIWHSASTGRRFLAFVVAALLLAGLAATAFAWFATVHGSDAFTIAMGWGRILLQLSAGTALAAVPIIYTRPKKRDSGR